MAEPKTAKYSSISDVPIEQAIYRAGIGASNTNSRVYARNLSTGTMRGEQQLGDDKIQIDSNNRRIIIYDENGDARVLIGYDEDGF